MRYKAKTDWMVSASLLCGIAAPAFIAVMQNLPWLSLASVLAAVIVFGISYPQWYEIRDEALIVRSGLTTRLIPYTRLVSVGPASDRNDRLAVQYDIGSFLIAPQKPDEFLADLEAHAKRLTRRGRDLVVASQV